MLNIKCILISLSSWSSLVKNFNFLIIRNSPFFFRPSFLLGRVVRKFFVVRYVLSLFSRPLIPGSALICCVFRNVSSLGRVVFVIFTCLLNICLIIVNSLFDSVISVSENSSTQLSIISLI